MAMESRFRVVIFSGADPDRILQLARRIHGEVPEAQVCGVLSERRPGKTISRRIVDFLRNLRDRDFIRYAASKILDQARIMAAKPGSALLKFVHGGGPGPVHKEDPLRVLDSLDCAFRVTSDYHNEDSLQFVRSLNADLGIVYGTRILKPCLFSIPRHGSINIHKRKFGLQRIHRSCK